MTRVRVQAEDFDIGAEIARLTAGRTDIGAVVSFTGLVRATNGGTSDRRHDARALSGHGRSRARAQSTPRPQRAGRCSEPHRDPPRRPLAPGENIVLVVTASAHRDAAFEAASS